MPTCAETDETLDPIDRHLDFTMGINSEKVSSANISMNLSDVRERIDAMMNNLACTEENGPRRFLRRVDWAAGERENGFD